MNCKKAFNQLGLLLKLSRLYDFSGLKQKTSTFRKNDDGTIQGSVLGPIMFSIFIRPIYDLIDLSTYADDNYMIETSKDLKATIGKVKMKANFLISWFKASGMKINPEKTEIVIFHKTKNVIEHLEIDNKVICSKDGMNILGIHFDNKLNWQKHINIAILKAKKTSQAIKILSRYLPLSKLVQIATSYFYQRLFYGSVVWLIPTLNRIFKHKLLQASANILRICCKDYRRLLSFSDLHVKCNRATPLNWSYYATALHVHQILNNKCPEKIFDFINNKLIFHDRSNLFYMRPMNKLRIGKNCISNRSMFMKCLNRDIFNLPRDSFQKYVKGRFLNPAI